MKKIVALFLAAMMLAGVLAGCASAPATSAAASASPAQQAVSSTQESTPAAGEPLKVVCVIPGFLGDKSIFDSADNGIKMAQEEFGDRVETKFVEMGTDPSKYESVVREFAEDDWDIIILCSFRLLDLCTQMSGEYPEKKFILNDTSVDYEAGDFENVYCIKYKQNEGSYLAGALAGLITTSDMPLANEEKVIGFVGGQDTFVINDFMYGYIEGALSIDPDIKIASAYVGDFVNTAKAKELAIAQIQQKADIIFQAAAQAGWGVLDAAKENDIYAIGVDGDQAAAFMETDQDIAEKIVTSMLKRVDNALLRAIQLELDGTLPWGTLDNLGLKEGGVGLAKNEYYESLTTPEMQSTLDEIEAKIISGEIEVPSAFGMTSEEFAAYRDSVRP